MPTDQKRTKTKKNTPDIQAVDFGNVPPQALDLEDAVLGALLLEKDAFSLVGEILKPEFFYSKQNGTIFEAIKNLASKDAPIDMLTVRQQLQTMGELENIGGVIRLAELTSNMASAAHLEYHAKIVASKYLSRELIRVSSHIAANAYEDKIDVQDQMNEAEGLLFEVSQRNIKKDVVPVNAVLPEAIRRMQEAAKQTDGYSGFPSGFYALDKITSGWQRSDLIIIAARPAMGKTAFVLSMAKNMAVDLDIPVAVFSLEMSNIQLANRLISNVCELPSSKIKNGGLERHEWAQLDHKIKALHSAPIYIDDTASLSVLELRSKARRLVREHDVKAIFIDYLQLMNASGMNFYSRQEEVSLISRSLKSLAKELDIPIVALSQLNRSVEGRSAAEGKVPQLSDLRESGAIEQDADMVCFIHRPEYYHITEDPSTGKDLRGLAQIIIAKHRNGATDTVHLRFRGELTKFSNENEDSEAYEMLGSKINDSNNFSSLPPAPPSDNDMPMY